MTKPKTDHEDSEPADAPDGSPEPAGASEPAPKAGDDAPEAPQGDPGAWGNGGPLS